MSASSRLPVHAVLGIALAGYLLIALAYPLIDPDEGRNAEVVREMVAGGDLVTPHLAGMPYLDKPPGLFWAAAIPVRLMGPIPLAARLPAIVAALLTLVLIARLARREADASFAWRVAALTATAPLFAAIAAYVIFDMPLALCVTAIWTALARELIHGADPRRRAWMFAALAAGLLIKGPVMLAWAVGGSLAVAALDRSRAPLRWLAWLPGWAIPVVLAGGWFALATARFPEYPRYAFLEESVERMTSGAFHRDQPWWFVPAVLAGGALPWSLATPWWRAGAAPRSEPRRVVARVALGFVLFAAVFFTLSRSKLVTYLVPAIPPLAWLAAEAWSDSRRSRAARSPWSAAPRALVLAASPVVTIVALVIAAPIARSSSGAPLARAIAASGGGPVTYEGCYSPGTDFLLGRGSTLVSDRGEETTSNYQLRYRDALIRRGLWTPLGAGSGVERSGVLVRRSKAPPPPGWDEMFRDERFIAWRRAR
ncbi:MAG: glycosyltransferase family 39 protein [Candidatus Eisenbacteria bacterium]|uniref:Glycosyltransferase family 39 protein n=1 Tax=Eiseniibacteriota bacterium TaxID=2212470 RepID=A0A9D6QI48_UNCEI|nr:glycosyltransferase family 39 protein [Candidatus Eisenbacteria bacterium]